MAINNFIDRIKIGNSTDEIAIGSSAYGECDTAAGTTAKTVNIPGFILNKGTTIHVKFIHANTASDPTLNVSNTGNIPLRLYGTTAMGGTASTTGWNNNAILTLTYDGSGWIRDQGYNTNSTYTLTEIWCGTGASTAAKVASNAVYYYNDANALGTNMPLKHYFELTLRYANTKASALTLNVNSTGEKPIYINGSPSSSTNYTLPRGKYIVYYDGSVYHFRTDGKLPGNIAGDAGTVNGHTVLSDVPANADFNDTKQFTITANATDGYWDLTGTNGTNAVTYALAPYDSKQSGAHFYLGTDVPNGTTRLNYNGKFYATELYSNNTKVALDGHSHSNYLTSIGWDNTNKKITQTVGGSASNKLEFIQGNNITLTAASDSLTIAATDTTYSNFVKSGADAAAGLVPAPSTTAGTTKFLCEDGQWKIPSYTTTLALSSITGTDDLQAIENLTGTGFLKRTANNTWSLNSITSSDLPVVDVTKGGTGIEEYTIGDIIYASAATALSKLSGNTTTTRKFLRSVANTSGTAIAPAWDTVTNTDVGLSNVTNHAQVTSIAYDNTTHKLTYKVSEGKAITIATFGSHADDSTSYLPLSGGNMSGCINRHYAAASTDPLISVSSSDKNITFFQVGHKTNVNASFGNNYQLQYQGGNNLPNNYLDLIAESNSSNSATAIRVNNNGIVTFPAMDDIGAADTPIYLLDGALTAGTQLKALAYKASLEADDIPGIPWSKLTSGVPTTLSGYGIIDANINTTTGVLTLGNDSITPITSVNGHTGSSVSVTASDLGLSNALHFIGQATQTITNGGTQHPTIPDETYSGTDGDVVIDASSLREYVWSDGAWLLLGYTSSQLYSMPSGDAVTNQWISKITQNTDGTITAFTSTLDTSGTWSGTASKVTTTANTTGTLYLVGVLSGSTTTLRRDTSITIKGAEILTGTWNASTIALNKGGTGATSVNKYGILFGNSSQDAYESTSTGTDGQVIIGKGTDAAPNWYSGLTLSGVGTSQSPYNAEFGGNVDVSGNLDITGGISFNSTNNCGDAYTPIYWNNGVPGKVTTILRESFTLGTSTMSAAATVTTTISNNTSADSRVVQIVVTDGMSNLHSVIQWQINSSNQIQLSATTQKVVSGYILYIK